MADSHDRRRNAPPPGVAERLKELRALYRSERCVETRARMTRERPVDNRRFEVAVEARLRELRALCGLAGYLRNARFAPSDGEASGPAAQTRSADKKR